MAPLHVTLLGSFGLTLPDGMPVHVETRKARAVLAILLMAGGRAVPRERLAGMLWSRGESRQSLASLSQALYSLRRALDEAVPDLIWADVEAVSVDITRTEVDALAVVEASKQGTEEAWQRCLGCYRGDFLEDLAIDLEEGYSDWRASEQARLEESATRAGSALMAAWEARPDAAAPDLVDRLLLIDPYSEAAIRVKMLCLGLEGRAATAIDTAERFATRLSQDLEIEPSPELGALVETIRTGDLRAATKDVKAPAVSKVDKRQIRSAFGAALLFAAALSWLWFSQDPLPDPTGMRILVRPFAAGPGLDDGVAAGFGDDLSTELVRRSSLEILSRESGRLISQDAERVSGASHVLRGRLREDGDQLVLNLWIIDLEKGREVWAGRFTGSAADLHAFRNSVVERVADQIDLALVPAPDPPLLTVSPEAVPDYLRALSLLHAGLPEPNAEAIAALTGLLETHPRAAGPTAALAMAYQRVAFGADDYARAAGLHWLEGYLALKTLLAGTDSRDPGLLSVHARLALRRLDYHRAEALARQALRAEPGHVAALEVLGRTLALTGATEEAVSTARRAIALAPATPGDGYEAMALAHFYSGDVGATRTAATTGIDLSRVPSLKLLVVAAASAALEGDLPEAEVAFSALVSSVQNRPFGAWRLGDVAYENPRAATWRRPRGGEAALLIGFSDPEVQSRLYRGLELADPSISSPRTAPVWRRLSGGEIEETMFGRKIIGATSWLVQENWIQVRTDTGQLFQTGAFGPIPGAQDAASRVFQDSLCDQWLWQGEEIEACQWVLRATDFGHALHGETGVFPFMLDDRDR